MAPIASGYAVHVHMQSHTHTQYACMYAFMHALLVGDGSAFFLVRSVLMVLLFMNGWRVQRCVLAFALGDALCHARLSASSVWLIVNELLDSDGM